MIGKIASWAVWTALIVVITIVVYRHANGVTPATTDAKGGVNPMLFAMMDNSSRAPQAENVSSESRLDVARKAFFHGDDDLSIKLYNEYIKNNARDPDIRGELGNVYYANGRLIDAAGAYYDAANLLLEANRFADVEFLLPTIAELQPMLAEELKMKLAAGRGNRMEVPASSTEILQRPPQSALTRY